MEFSPKLFLKKRRPERFSDSISLEVGVVDRAVFEHFLSTLNRRSEELAFEGFAKKLCEREICPNLLEQTGPVAGGDGKTDFQTFPVSEEIAFKWLHGYSDASHTERLAFAVSTQIDWKAKCRKDIRKIKSTERGYEKAFFVTNQYAKSNQRSELEDSLKKETGIDVRILDISWLLDCSLKDSNQDIIFSELSIKPQTTNLKKIGPNDFRREADLKIKLSEIDSILSNSKLSYEQVDLFIDVAILSKELEHSKQGTRGLFDRAVRVTKQHGTSKQLFSVYYEYAWASHWWFEDFDTFLRNLSDAYDCIKLSTDSSLWEDLVTLITVYVGHRRISPNYNKSEINIIIKKSKEKLEEISCIDSLPSNSLKAKTTSLILSLMENEDKDERAKIFLSLLDIAKTSQSLIGYPFESLANLITELDFAYGEDPEYEELLDYLAKKSGERYGEVQYSISLARRGARKLESKKPYEAITLLGKALTGLYKHESRGDIVNVLVTISYAYESINLFWAARGSALYAASVATDSFYKTELPSNIQVIAYKRLMWLELRLGRIGQCLVWHRFAEILAQSNEVDSITEEERQSFDAFLGQKILRSDFETIKELEFLPDVLDRFGLFSSSTALLFSLGHEEKLTKEIGTEIDAEFVDVLKNWRDYAFEDKKNFPISIYRGKYKEIESVILGCKVTVSFPIRTPFVELGESVLSVLESFCSTLMTLNATTIESHVQIDISSDDSEEVIIEHSIDDSGSELIFNLQCSNFSISQLNVEAQKKIFDWLKVFVFEFYARIILVEDFEGTINGLLGDKALERSISFTPCFMTQHNILGDSVISDYSEILKDSEIEYKNKRTISWDPSWIPYDDTQKIIEEYSPAKVSAPENFLNKEQLTHTDLVTQSLIKPRHWDGAKWLGMGVVIFPEKLPMLVVCFKNESGAENLWKHLKKELGEEDILNRLRITIIKNISASSPQHYRVHISEKLVGPSTRLHTNISRFHTMTPNDLGNINSFLESFNNIRKFAVSYGILSDSQMSPPKLLKQAIAKTELIVKNAWEIGLNDLDSVAILPDDDPLIPDDIENVPILALLEKKRKI